MHDIVAVFVYLYYHSYASLLFRATTRNESLCTGKKIKSDKTEVADIFSGSNFDKKSNSIQRLFSNKKKMELELF